jgi:hypothetical protein
MKIGIYTIHTSYNYGALFQAYATQRALEKMGYETELVNLYPIEEERKNESKILSFKIKSLIIFLYAMLNPKIRVRFKRFRSFRSEMSLSKRYYTIDEIYNNPPVYDIHLVGSDQVWNLESGIPKQAFYFLDFLPKDVIKISYASSFGISAIDKQYYSRLKQLLSTFKAISVREDEGVKIVSEATGLEAKQVMDPTFLLSDHEWSSLTTVDPIIKGDYIFCYGFDNSERSRSILSAIRKRTSLPIVYVGVGLTFPIKVDCFFKEAGPREFINLMINAKLVCTGSFHGIAMSIHLRKSFFSTVHPTRNSRMKSMLRKLGLEHRQLDEFNTLFDMTDEELYIDYKIIENEIKYCCEYSLDWLKNTIDSFDITKV